MKEKVKKSLKWNICVERWLWFSNIFMLEKSIRLDLFCKKGVLRNFTKLTAKHLCESLFFNKVAGRGCFMILIGKLNKCNLLPISASLAIKILCQQRFVKNAGYKNGLIESFRDHASGIYINFSVMFAIHLRK